MLSVIQCQRTSAMSAASEKPDSSSLPGKGMFGWFGRQIGYVRHAVKHKVLSPNDVAKVFRSTQIEEQILPHQPNVKLRRTTIDEVLINPQKPADVD